MTLYYFNVWKRLNTQTMRARSRKTLQTFAPGYCFQYSRLLDLCRPNTAPCHKIQTQYLHSPISQEIRNNFAHRELAAGHNYRLQRGAPVRPALNDSFSAGSLVGSETKLGNTLTLHCEALKMHALSGAGTHRGPGRQIMCAGAAVGAAGTGAPARPRGTWRGHWCVAAGGRSFSRRDRSSQSTPTNLAPLSCPVHILQQTAANWRCRSRKFRPRRPVSEWPAADVTDGAASVTGGASSRIPPRSKAPVAAGCWEDSSAVFDLPQFFSLSSKGSR